MNEHPTLEEKALLWTRAFENAEIGIALINHNTERFIDVNATFAAQRGYERSEMIGMSLLALYPPEEHERILREITHSTERRDHGIIERLHMRKDGSRMLVRVDYTVIRGTGHEPPLRVVFAQDLSERKRAEDAEAKLREVELRLRFALEHSPIVMWSQDVNLRYTWVRDQNLHFPMQYVLGKTDEELIEPGEAAVLTTLKRRVLETGIPADEQIRVTVGGKTYVYQINVDVQRDENGTITGLRGAAIDMTERVRAAEERHLRNQLAQAQHMEAIGRLAGGVAHDFNNMLGVILGQAEMALGQVDAGHPIYRRLIEILNAAERSAKLTRQLLAFARKQTATPEVIDLNQTVEGMLMMLERLVGDHVELVYIPGESVWLVHIDPTQVDQILANLCVNARDAIEGAGRIEIETANVRLSAEDCAGHADRTPGEYGMLLVRDNGMGMSKEVLAHIFEPFFTTKEMGAGTGLGLSTVHGIVTQNRGIAAVRSEAGRGTEFRIYLPRYTGVVRREARWEGKLKEGLRLGQVTVLYVEEDPVLLRLGQVMLEEMGCTVLAAGLPGDALRLAARHAGPIDLLIVDVIMPEMNGGGLWERLSGPRPKLKVLYKSGYPLEILKRHGLLGASTPCVLKPMTREALEANVAEVLGAVAAL